MALRCGHRNFVPFGGYRQEEIERCLASGRNVYGLRGFVEQLVEMGNDMIFPRRNVVESVRAIVVREGVAAEFDDQDVGPVQWAARLLH